MSSHNNVDPEYEWISEVERECIQKKKGLGVKDPKAIANALPQSQIISLKLGNNQI